MALINCPECGKEISDKAITCPNCGAPPAKVATAIEDLLQCPDFPNDLSIGKQIVNWRGDACLTGFYDGRENVNENIPTGKVHVILHTHGIQISSRFYSPLFQIHNSQIISIRRTSRAELVRIDKSVIGRAVIGGLILGPLGAVIGGMSGLDKEKLKDRSFLVINYWDVEARVPQTLLISGDDSSIRAFIERQKKENKTNTIENK